MHTLPNLPYNYDALEKAIDARTMEIHHGKHHQTYVNNLNKSLESAGGSLIERDIEWVLRNLGEIPEAQRTAVRNNGGGHFNHSLFWTQLSPGGGGKPKGELAAAIDRELGSFEAFKKRFAESAATRFGSGWAWLSIKDGKLVVHSTPNQDNPLMDASGIPILGLDVWEHAYYLRYQNRRPDYVEALWDLYDWNEADRRYREAIKK